MSAGDDAGTLGRREVLVALGVTLAIVGGAFAIDPAVRATLLSQPAIREVLCDDTVQVDLATNLPGQLAAPEGGVAVRVRQGEANVSALLELHRRDPGGEWRLAWQLDAPSGREIFYVAAVTPGTEAYVLAKPYAQDLCPARSGVLAAAA